MAVRGQFLFHIRTNIEELYSFLKDSTAMAQRIQYLLEGDRFMCLPNGYEVHLKFLAPQIADARYDLFVRQRNMWLWFTKETIQQERCEGFTKDNDAIYAELQGQLAGDSLIDALVWNLPVEWGQDSLDPSQETDMSLDFRQMSADLESEFLDSDPASLEDRYRQTEELGPENTRSPDLSSPLSLSLEDFEAREASPGARGNIQ
ncbi:hypothetical protein B9Z19DRAFT_1130862 [Tuber borchii]|uniref:Uncharacterized protein n=1 Tax=Tuber borchii TaxID=42251 RepID=A0A2T6ZJM6_TUBBO|nr:hypothetical protein B9Z19DRAFT_1130862 [Tuber borchii]